MIEPTITDPDRLWQIIDSQKAMIAKLQRELSEVTKTTNEFRIRGLELTKQNQKLKTTLVEIAEHAEFEYRAVQTTLSAKARQAIREIT